MQHLLWVNAVIEHVFSAIKACGRATDFVFLKSSKINTIGEFGEENVYCHENFLIEIFILLEKFKWKL